MKISKKTIQSAAITGVFIILLACSIPSRQSINNRPTEVGKDIILTFSALATETVEHIPPTFTPTSTSIPSTETFIPTITQTYTARPTLTPLPPKTGCELISQTPRGWTTMGPRWDFDAIWTIKNTGLFVWDKDEVDFRYIHGEKMQKRMDVFIFSSDIKPGDSVDIRLDMMAPEAPGKYSSVWGLVNKGTVQCYYSINIIVE